MARLDVRGLAPAAVLGDVLRLFVADVKLGEGGFSFASDCIQGLAAWTEALAEDRFRLVIEGRFLQAEGSLRDRRREAEASQGDLRRAFKRELYVFLSDLTGIHYPWGSLTGVRPTQMAAEEEERGGRAAALAALTGRWLVAADKARLALRVAAAEQAILKDLPPHTRVAYVGIPFCPSRCHYCSFISRDARFQGPLLKPYLEALLEEVRSYYEGGDGRTLEALYLGGGTPTVPDEETFTAFLTGLFRRLPEAREITVEAGRPETITRGKLALMQTLGVGHLSVNPQSMHDETLARIGRGHTVAQIVEALSRVRDYPFLSVNMDLIAGLPGEAPADFLDSLRQVLRLEPTRVTLHALARKRSSVQSERQERRLFLPDPAWLEAFSLAQEILEREGYRPYYLYRQKYAHSGLENVGFARDGGSLYNVAMMSDRVAVLGFGSGATSKAIEGTRARRQINARDVALYMEGARQSGREKQDLLRRHRPDFSDGGARSPALRQSETAGGPCPPRL